mmetsp:Transcript_91354/g.254402  ORF Transcript_91354/g.254402 Transcript_91354/m.254402 type:complete len:219 (-) Transcript_91354:820-1476(-)
MQMGLPPMTCPVRRLRHCVSNATRRPRGASPRSSRATTAAPRTAQEARQLGSSSILAVWLPYNHLSFGSPSRTLLSRSTTKYMATATKMMCSTDPVKVATLKSKATCKRNAMIMSIPNDKQDQTSAFAVMAQFTTGSRISSTSSRRSSSSNSGPLLPEAATSCATVRCLCVKMKRLASALVMMFSAHLIANRLNSAPRAMNMLRYVHASLRNHVGDFT